MRPFIDVHCHVSPFSFPTAPQSGAGGRWPCMQCDTPVDGTLLIGDKTFRKLDSRSWSAARRLEDMEKDGIAVQVLSPMPELLSYWLAVEDATAMCEHINAQIAEMISTAPTRFRGLGAVPLQDPDRAAEYLLRCKSEFGLSGVEIGSNINGAMLGDRRFDPFFAAAEALGMAVFIHALHPMAAKAVNATPAYNAFVCFPIDVAMTAASLLMAGTLERFPRLRLAFSHGAGALGSILGRLDAGWSMSHGFAGEVSARPSLTARQFFFDGNVLDREYLHYLITRVAPGQVFVGTDYPYDIRQIDPGQFISGLGLDVEQDKSLRYGAAGRLLGENFNLDGNDEMSGVAAGNPLFKD